MGMSVNIDFYNQKLRLFTSVDAYSLQGSHFNFR